MLLKKSALLFSRLNIMYPEHCWSFIVKFIAGLCWWHCHMGTHTIEKTENAATGNPHGCWRSGTAPEGKPRFRGPRGPSALHIYKVPGEEGGHTSPLLGVPCGFQADCVHPKLPVMQPALPPPDISTPGPQHTVAICKAGEGG